MENIKEKLNKTKETLLKFQGRLEKDTGRNSKKSIKKADKKDKNSVNFLDFVDTTKVFLFENKLILATLVILIIAFAAGYSLKSVFFAAKVNGVPITRAQIRKEAEKTQGSQILENKISEILIQQEAKKQKIEISEEELASEISGIEDSVKAQGQDLDTLLTLQGMTREDLNKQMKLQLVIEKILSSQVSVADEEVDAYIQSNADNFPEDTDFEAIKGTIKDQLLQQKLSQSFNAWLEGLKSEASIEYFVEYK